MTEELIKAQDVFLDRINHICSKFGLNNIMAQLYVILYFSSVPMSLDDMVKRLKISKGSASVNMRALERYGAVQRVWVKGSRKDYYEAETDISKVIKDRVKSMASSRLLAVNEMISSSSNMLSSASVESNTEDESVKVFKERLAKLKNLYEQAQAMFELFNAMTVNKTAEKDAVLISNGTSASHAEERI